MSKYSGRPPKTVVSRRVLLAAGGLVVLGEYLAGQGSAARNVSASAAPSPAAGTVRRPAARIIRDPAAHDGARAVSPGADLASSPPARPGASTPAGPGNGRPMYSLDDGPKVIALTIDDGPSPKYTPQVLHRLQRYGVTATFSMVGVNVAANRALAREVADAGHQIVNHTWTHANLPRLTPGAISSQLTRAQDVIGTATGRHPAMFRAPYGAWSPAVLDRCRRLGLAPLDWSVDPRDWARPGVGSIVANIMRNTRSGSIILEHDGGGNRAETVAALGVVLPRLLEAGYRFGTP
ncbi:MAG TPA: polysaccharide deacetylase family protein [Streptosporangiaceae bacterium]